MKIQELALAEIASLKLPNSLKSLCAVTITDSPAMPRPKTKAKNSCAERASEPRFRSRSRGRSETGKS